MTVFLIVSVVLAWAVVAWVLAAVVTRDKTEYINAVVLEPILLTRIGGDPVGIRPTTIAHMQRREDRTEIAFKNGRERLLVLESPETIQSLIDEQVKILTFPMVNPFVRTDLRSDGSSLTVSVVAGCDEQGGDA